jgi:hypothetical protein
MDPKADQINRYISHFTEVYPKGQSPSYPPEDTKVTVWCDNDGDSRGFLWNVTDLEIGLEALIMKKWILQSDIEKLIQADANS